MAKNGSDLCNFYCKLTIWKILLENIFFCFSPLICFNYRYSIAIFIVKFQEILNVELVENLKPNYLPRLIDEYTEAIFTIVKKEFI